MKLFLKNLFNHKYKIIYLENFIENNKFDKWNVLEFKNVNYHEKKHFPQSYKIDYLKRNEQIQNLNKNDFYIINDEFVIARMWAKHLHNLGFKHIAILIWSD